MTWQRVMAYAMPALAVLVALVMYWRLDRLSKPPKYPPLSPKPRDFDAPSQERE